MQADTRISPANTSGQDDFSRRHGCCELEGKGEAGGGGLMCSVGGRLKGWGSGRPRVTLEILVPNGHRSERLVCSTRPPACISFRVEAQQNCETAGCRGEGERTGKTAAMPRKLDSDTRIHFRTYEVSFVGLTDCTHVSRRHQSTHLVPCGTKATARSERPHRSHPIPTHVLSHAHP